MIPATGDQGQIRYGDTLLRIENVNGNFVGRAVHGLYSGESFYLAPCPRGRISHTHFIQKLTQASISGFVWADQCYLSSDKTTLFPSYLTVLKSGGCRQTRIVGTVCGVDARIPVTGMAKTVDDLVKARSSGGQIEMFLSAFKFPEGVTLTTTDEVTSKLVHLCQRSSSPSWTPALLIISDNGESFPIRAQRDGDGYDIEQTIQYVAEHEVLSQHLSGKPLWVVPGGSLRMSRRSVDSFFRRLFSGAARGHGVAEHFMKTIRTENGGIKVGPGVICSQMKSGSKGVYEFATEFKFTGDWCTPYEYLKGGSNGH